MDIGQKLRAARTRADLTLQDVAKALGISHQAVQQMETGKTSPRLETIISLAKLYKASLDDIMLNSGINVGSVGLAARRVPIISWVQAGAWCGVTDPYPAGQGDQLLMTTAHVGPSSYALKVRGDSMTNPDGGPSFPDGTYIVVDPEVTAVHGDFVVCRLENTNEATFKQLVVDGGEQFLKPLNPRYPLIKIDAETTLCGVVKQAITNF